MPTYDYKCNNCGTRFEIKRSMNDESPVPCGECQSTDTVKLVTGAPHIAIAWKNTLGLGHSGQIALPAVVNKRLRREVRRADRNLKSRRKHESKVHDKS